MNKKTRLIILLICIGCFFIVAPILVLYSMGDRFDFANMRITATGGIYVRTSPAARQVLIDSKISGKPNIFSSSVFIQSLLPGPHTVLAEKDGYYDYFKTIPVQKNQVTKLENVLLFKKLITFGELADKVDYFSVTPNNQNFITATVGAKNITINYFSFGAIEQNKTLPIPQTGKISDIKWSEDSNRAVIIVENKNIISYYLFDNTLSEPVATPLSYLDKNAQQVSFNPQNSQELFFIKNNTLYSAKSGKVLPVLNDTLAYNISGGNILWLSTDELLYNSDLSGKLIEQITDEKTTVNSIKDYSILSLSGKTFLRADDSFFLLNQSAKTLDKITPPISSYKISVSPDNKNLIFYNESKIYLRSFLQTEKLPEYNEIFLGTSINDCQWLNSDYIIFTVGDKIIISEIDYRGNINAVTLPTTITVSSDKKIDIKNPDIYFNRQDGKLYIMTDNTFLVSEKITQ